MMTTPPAIDYTNKDFASLRRAMPRPGAVSPAGMDRSVAGRPPACCSSTCSPTGDVVLYYRIGSRNESFLQTATERRSVMHLLRLIATELTPPVPASTELTLVFAAAARRPRQS